VSAVSVVTHTVTVQLPFAGICAPKLSAKIAKPPIALTFPPAHLVVAAPRPITMGDGRWSSSSVVSVAVVAVGLERVIVTEDSPFGAIRVGVNDFAKDGATPESRASSAPQADKVRSRQTL
jgi:hypothetical protein